jgi:uncharacterized RDD family membrane protein YckC
MEPVGLGPRILAGIIDVIIMMLIIIPLTFIAGQSMGAQIGVGFIGIVYFIVMEALKGATIGKMAMKLRVVKAADGSAISWGESIIRNLLRIVDGFFFYVVGMIVIAVTAKKQRVGDLAASTIVVRQ